MSDRTANTLPDQRYRDLANAQWMYANTRAVFDDLFRTIAAEFPHIWSAGDGHGGGLVRLMQEAAETHGFYAPISTPAFTQRNVVRELIERDGHQCTYCDVNLNTILDPSLNPTVDHITPKSKGGTDDLSNLTLSCKSCNPSKGALSVTEWSNKR